ncbi:MAG TPA: prepilin-type N-terminal cleavage/methylation domain-containing protein [Telluria sp.]
MHSFDLPPAVRHRSGGFTLIEVAIVVVIIGLAAAMLIGLTGGMLDANRRKAVRVQLDMVDTALANFVATHKRLPCPANGRIASGAVNAGVEAVTAGACNPISEIDGVLPWATLGLSETEATDPWNGRLTYRVDPALAGATGLMNMSQCDPAATGGTGPGGSCSIPAASCTGSASCTSPSSFLAGKGLDVWDGRNAAAGFAQRQNNRPNGSGAAYVVISHGPSRAGSYGSNGVLVATAVASINPDDELPNMSNQAVVLNATQANVYRDAPLNELQQMRPATPPGQAQYYLSYFDDYLSHPTIMAVLNRANLGPRPH